MTKLGRVPSLTSAAVLVVSLLSATSVQAADALRYFKNYFITGDFVAAGVGLRSTGVGGFASGNIVINTVPCTAGSPAAGYSYVDCSTQGAVPADIIAAFLYWTTEVNTSTGAVQAASGTFRGQPIEGQLIGNANNPACWSSGGTTGPTNAKGLSYRADVLHT